MASGTRVSDVPCRQVASSRPKRRTMRAARLVAPRSWAVEETAVPEPAEGEVRIRLRGCGVCGSNLPPWEGRPWFDYPLEHGSPGHEGWGVVDALGRGVEGLRPGDPVTMLSYHAFREYDIADASAVVALPQQLDSMHFPGEALGCAMNVWRRCAVQESDVVAIVGLGFLGSLLVQLAVGSGATVIAINRRRGPLRLAMKFGAQHQLELDDGETVVRRVHELTDGAGCHCAIEATGLAEPLEVASKLVRTRGRLVIAGYHQDGPRQINLQDWNWRGLDVINAHERDPAIYRSGIAAAVDAVDSGRLDPAPLYSHVWPLDRINDAFAIADERPEGFMKSLVVMHEERG